MVDQQPHALVDEYERLRRYAFSNAFSFDRRAGYGLLVQRGMLVWMRTWAACTVSSSAAPTCEVPTPPAVEAELVEVLTALILSSYLDKNRYGKRTFHYCVAENHS